MAWHKRAPPRGRFGRHRPGLEQRLLEVDRQVSSKPGPSQTRSTKPELLGKFELLERVGQGGCGTVYKARDRDLNRTVALKVPRSGSFRSDGERQRFLREARSAAGFRHPAICPVYEAGEQEGQAYIAMGYIAGQTLGVWAAERGISAREAAQIVAKAARATHYAHERGIIHRDIKPGNVMIDAETGEPVLMDFGLAKEMSEQAEALTETGDVMGTPADMAPEQAAGRKDQMGPAADIYSLGAVLYELVAGRPPFQGTVGEVLMKVQSVEAMPLRKVAPRVHRDLETICAKALATIPADRYSSAAALADDLERFQAGEAILARREGPTRKLVRRIRRRPVFSAFLAATVLIVAGAFTFAWRGMEVHRVSSLLASIEANLSEGPWEAAAPGRVDNDSSRHVAKPARPTMRGRHCLAGHSLF